MVELRSPCLLHHGLPLRELCARRGRPRHCGFHAQHHHEDAGGGSRPDAVPAYQQQPLSDRRSAWADAGRGAAVDGGAVCPPPGVGFAESETETPDRRRRLELYHRRDQQRLRQAIDSMGAERADIFVDVVWTDEKDLPHIGALAENWTGSERSRLTIALADIGQRKSRHTTTLLADKWVFACRLPAGTLEAAERGRPELRAASSCPCCRRP